MEKFKNFVSKFHWLFKLAAIALLVVMIFAPFIYFSPARTRYDSFWMLTKLFIGLDFSLYNQYVLGLGCFITVIAAVVTAVLLAASLFWKKLLRIALFFYIFVFAIAASCTIYFMTSNSYYSIFTLPESVTKIPYIAFYAAIILLIADIVTLVLMKKPISKKDAKIADLEKRIEELENGKDGK